MCFNNVKSPLILVQLPFKVFRCNVITRYVTNVLAFNSKEMSLQTDYLQLFNHETNLHILKL